MEDLSSDLVTPQQAPDLNAAPESGLPEPIGSVLKGVQPGFLVPANAGQSGDATAAFLRENLDDLVAGGLDFTELEDGSCVFFNPAVIKAEAIDAAIADGTIAQITPPIGAPAAQEAPVGDLSSVDLPPVAPISLAPPKAEEMRPINAARADQLKTKKPTDKAIPAAGFQNNLAKRPI